MKLRELAARLECPLEGDGDIDITRVATLEHAGSGDIAFLANPKYASQLPRFAGVGRRSSAPASTARPVRCCAPRIPISPSRARPGCCIPTSGRSPAFIATAIVGEGAIVEEGVAIGPYVVIGAGARIGARTIILAHTVIGANAVIGPNCLIHARVSIRERVQIGARVVVQDGAVIGSDGFGFAPRDDGTHEKIPQVATVVIEDDVEIGANTTIDRPAVGETRVQAGTKIDNLVQIAHGVVVGKNSLLAAQVGIAGSTIVGEQVMLGGQVGVTGHVTVGDRAKASAKTGVTSNIPPDSFVTGYPHMNNLEWRKSSAVFRRLPEMRKQLSDLDGTPGCA